MVTEARASASTMSRATLGIDHGYLLTIEGRMHGSSMNLGGIDHLPNGNPRQVRGEWRPQDRGVREVAARSTDGGVTWAPWFDLLFLPHRPTAHN